MGHRLKLALIIAVAAVYFWPDHAVYAENLLKNAGFEESDFPPAEWADWSGSGSNKPDDGVAGFLAGKEAAHSGDKCAAKILYGYGERWGGYSQTADIPQAGMLNASAWVMNKRTDVALSKGAHAYLEIKFVDDGNVEIKKIKSPAIRNPAAWTKLSARSLIPAKARKAIFSFVLIGPKGAGGKVFFDDAYLSVSF